MDEHKKHDSKDLLMQARFQPPQYCEGLLVPQQGWFAGQSEKACSVARESPFEQYAKVDGSLLEKGGNCYAGSYSVGLSYDPAEPGNKRQVRLSGYMRFKGPETQGDCVGIGLSAPLPVGEEDLVVPNALIGVRLQDDKFVTYLSNWEGTFVNGIDYELGKWIHQEAVFDFDNLTIDGYSNHEYMGQIPFTTNIVPIVSFLNMAVISSNAVPDSIACFDDLEVIAHEEMRTRSRSADLSTRPDLNPVAGLSELLGRGSGEGA